MAITKIILQQMVTMDQSSITASKYPKYTVVLSNSISSITAGELTAAIESSKASAAAAKQSEINAKQSELNAKDSENEAEISAASSQQSATQAAASATAAAASATAAENTAAGMKASIGLTTVPRHVSDITVEPSGFLGFIRIVRSTTTGYPSIASSENVLAGFISAMDGTPGYVGVFVGDYTGTLYSYRWTRNAGATWWKQVNYNTVDRYSQLNAETNFTNQLGTAKLLIDNNKIWGAYDNENRRYIPLAVAQGGTGAINVADARTNFGLSVNDVPQFRGTNLVAVSGAAQAASGILSGYLNNVSGEQRTRYRVYSEIRGDNKAWLTLHLQSDTSTNKYAGLSIDGNFQINGNFIGNAISLSDVSTSKVNLQVNRFIQNTAETDVVNPASTAQLFITDNKNWGAYDKELRKHIALPVTQGGTGGLTISEAKNNLQIPSVGAGDWLEIAAPEGVEEGKFYPVIIKAQHASLYASGFFVDIQTRSSGGADPMNCCFFNGFIRTGGWSDRKDAGYGYYNRYSSAELALKCILVSGKNAEDNIAVYVEARGFPIKMRIPQFCTTIVPTANFTAGEVTFAWGTANPATDSIGTNTLFDFSMNRVGFYQANSEGNYYIGNGQRIVLSNGMSVGEELSLTLPKITYSGTVAAGNGFIADGISVSNATFYSRYRVGDVVYGAEYRASENAAQVIVRDPAGTSHQFFNFNLNGTFSAPSGLLSSTGVDWNGQTNTINKFYGIAGQVNSPENNVVYGGVHIGFSGNYATQFAGRGNKFFARSIEGGTIGEWHKIVAATYGANTPIDVRDSFISDGSSAPTWVPVYGAGFQSCYATNRVGQVWVGANGSLYYRFLLSADPKTSSTDAAWHQVAAIDTNNTWTGENTFSKNITFNKTSATISNTSQGSNLELGSDIFLRTTDNNRSVFIGAGTVKITNSSGNKFIRHTVSGTSANSITLDTWGSSSSNRPTVYECKITDSDTQANLGWIFYAQHNTDDTKQLQVNGNVNCVAVNQSSDRDLKDNIEVIPAATESLRKMNGYTYTLKENGLPYAGVIAQEVLEALPEAVSSFTRYTEIEGATKDGTPLMGEERFYSVDYAAITGLLVQVNRESDNRITALESEISDLKKQIADLTLVVNSLLANRA